MKGLGKSVMSVAIAGREQSWCIRGLDVGADQCLESVSAARYLRAVCERELGITSARCGEDPDSRAPLRRILVRCRSLLLTWKIALSPVFGAITHQKIVVV